MEDSFSPEMLHIQCFHVSHYAFNISMARRCAKHAHAQDHGQGGAQGMEDGLALGLAFCGATDTSQIEERLSVYEKIRRNRASSIQILSNFGYDETVPEELHAFLEGCAMPSKSINFAYLRNANNIMTRVNGRHGSTSVFPGCCRTFSQVYDRVRSHI